MNNLYPVRDYKGREEEKRKQISSPVSPVRDYKGKERTQREQISNGANGTNGV